MPSLAVGSILARLLARAWRDDGDVADLTPAHLEMLAPRLLMTGTAGLVWERLRQTPLAALPVAQTLCRQQRRQAMEQLHLEHRLPTLFEMLRCEGLDPLLIKGWSVLRLYPRAGQRPIGDIDLCVPPDQFAAARRWLEQHGEHAQGVDLHAGVADLDDQPWDNLWQRSAGPVLRNVPIRVLCPEDQLRLLCLHFARHGGWRPLWLCDVAVAAEAMPPECNGLCDRVGSEVSRQWVACILALARRLLDARTPPWPVPHWIVDAVLRAWEADRLGDSHSRDDRPLREGLKRPLRVWHALRCRWPNPIEAAFTMRAAPSTRWPRSWHQVRFSLRRSLRWWHKESSPPSACGFAIHVNA